MQSWKIVSAAIVARGLLPDFTPACRRGADDGGRRGEEAHRGIQPSRWRPCSIVAGITDTVITAWHHRRHLRHGRSGARWACRRRHHWWRHRQQSGTSQRCGRLLRAAISLVRSRIRAPIWDMTAIGIRAHEEVRPGPRIVIRGPLQRKQPAGYLDAPGRGAPCRSLIGTQLFFRR